MKLRLWHILVFVAALVAAAIAFAPISLFVPSREGAFAYRAVSGSVWQARFEGARVGAIDAGAVDWRLSLFDLVQGRIQVDLAFDGGAIDGEVRMLGNFGGDRRLIAPNATISGATIGDDLALAGTTRIQNLDVYFSGGKCVTAAGALSSDVLERNVQTLHWRGPALGGEASCQDDGAAQLALLGAADSGLIQTRIELHQSGEGKWRAFAGVENEGLRQVLTAHGFAPEQGARTLSMTREFRWLP